MIFMLALLYKNVKNEKKNDKMIKLLKKNVRMDPSQHF